MTSTRSTIPAPPPNGVSSTWPPLSGVWSRGLSVRSSWPPALALRTWRWVRNHSNHSGNSVTTSSCIYRSSPRNARSTSMRRASMSTDAHRVGDQRHEQARRRRALAPRAARTTGRAASASTTPTSTVAVDDAQPFEVLGVPLVLLQRRRVGARNQRSLAAQRLGGLAGVDAGQAQDRPRVGSRPAHDRPRACRRPRPRPSASSARAAAASRGTSRRGRAAGPRGRR